MEPRKSQDADLEKRRMSFWAIGLMVTLVWLYIEFLRLLAKLQSRD